MLAVVWAAVERPDIVFDIVFPLIGCSFMMSMQHLYGLDVLPDYSMYMFLFSAPVRLTLDC